MPGFRSRAGSSGSRARPIPTTTTSTSIRTGWPLSTYQLRAGYTSFDGSLLPRRDRGDHLCVGPNRHHGHPRVPPRRLKQGAHANARMTVHPLPPDHGTPALTLFDETTGTTVGPSLPTPYDDEVWVDLAVLAPGTHVLHAVFTGDDYVHDSVSAPVTDRCHAGRWRGRGRDQQLLEALSAQGRVQGHGQDDGHVQRAGRRSRSRSSTPPARRSARPTRPR